MIKQSCVLPFGLFFLDTGETLQMHEQMFHGVVVMNSLVVVVGFSFICILFPDPCENSKCHVKSLTRYANPQFPLLLQEVRGE
jgi:hypothetical protein